MDISRTVGRRCAGKDIWMRVLFCLLLFLSQRIDRCVGKTSKDHYQYLWAHKLRRSSKFEALAMVTEAPEGQQQLNRYSFPKGFVFGAASSAYQMEGGWNLGGRTPSLWDTYTQQHPERIRDGSNGNEAVDSYHRYKEDVSLLKDLNMDAYRFSISWSRILFNGQLSGGINQEGINYYNNLIDELISKGLTPHVTLFHWDAPDALEQLYGGFLSPKIIEDFADYSEVCFKYFGDRVRNWITLNEPWTFSQRGYANGDFAPGRCSHCEGHGLGGDSATEPYIVGHNLLLAHAAAVKLYRENYQNEQKGQIGITLGVHWFHPMSRTKDDYDAARRSIDWMFGWFMDPLTQGDYPFTMRVVARDRLPVFTKEQSEMVKGSFDFLGLNYYTTHYASNIPFTTELDVTYDNDRRAFQSGYKGIHPIGPVTGSPWLFFYPQGLKELLLYLKEEYNNPDIYITENGVSERDDPSKTLEEALQDDLRIDYYDQHLHSIKDAISEGVQVKGFFAWSLCDNFEWNAGYTERFGIYYVDLETKNRYPKKSARWFKNSLKQ